MNEDKCYMCGLVIGDSYYWKVELDGIIELWCADCHATQRQGIRVTDTPIWYVEKEETEEKDND